MHEQDTKLICHASEFTTGVRRTKISDARRLRLADAIENYVIACEISSGPDEKRSAVWSGKAADRWTELLGQLSVAKNTGV